jgi:glycosyltransferase involved in cell wall biosynthesis
MKIVLFIRALEVGGSQSQVALLARGLARRSHSVTVVVLYPVAEGDRALTEAGVRVLSLAKRSRWDVIGPLWRFLRTLIAERPDVLYAFLPAQTVLSALLLPPWLPTRLVFGIRSADMQLDRYDTLSAIVHRLEAWLSFRANLIIANAAAGKLSSIRRGMPPKRIAIVANGIDTGAMRPDAKAGLELRKAVGLRPNDFVIGLIARLDPMKDHETFLQAASVFARKFADARFLSVGGGPASYREALHERAAALGLHSRILWLGERRELLSAFNACDLATLTSSFGEAFPNVVGEAMACGVPVVATDVGDTRSIIGPTGEIVPPQRPDLLSAAWERMRVRLTSEPELRNGVRAAIVARFGVDQMVERTESQLNDLTGPRDLN